MVTTINGGYVFRPEDEEVINTQRSITKVVNDRFIQVGAVYLKMNGKTPTSEDWAKMGYRDVDLQDWIDREDDRLKNVGFNLQLGWTDIDIDVPDREFNSCLLAALDFLGVDTRFRFGRRSIGYPTHVLVQLGEEESANFEGLSRFVPKMFNFKGERFHVEVRSFPTNLSEKQLVKSAKQTVMPGSIYTHKTEAGEYDLSVWYASNGTVADNVMKVAATTPRRAAFYHIVRAITFATFLYCVKDHWVSGSRQFTATKMAGWLARVVKDSGAMNNHEVVSSDVFCPVDTDEIVEGLLKFVCDYLHDDEPHMRVRTYYDAAEKLSRNPDAKIPGWPAIEQMLGGEAVQALRTVFMPGSDVSMLTKMADRYVFDESDSLYIDRKRHVMGGRFAHETSELVYRHKSDMVRISGKPREAFRVFESSDMRKRVDKRDMYPDLDPGGIYRFSKIGDLLADDDDEDEAVVAFNTWRGWPVAPATVVDPALMKQCEDYLNQLLRYMTSDNEKQADWAKKWVAWIFQNPTKKQQIAWVCVGGQGVGKSFFGLIFMKAIMGRLWGTAPAKIMETDFTVAPFIDKMFVFIDEAKFHGEGSTDEIKKMIRSVDVAGAEKFNDVRNYNIYARVMFAANRYNIGAGQAGVIDRALFYTKAMDKEYKNMTEMEFREWTETLKPWFAEFDEFLLRREVKEHYVRMFMDIQTSQKEVESIRLSSSGDNDILVANLAWSRKVAKFIVEDARIHEDLALEYPFTATDLNRRVQEVSKEMGLRNVQGQRVLQEFMDADLIERYLDTGKAMMRFKHKWADALQLFGAATGLDMEVLYEITESDRGVNDATLKSRLPWKGAKSTRF